MSFASNLLGAVVGGAIEYVAFVTGYQALAIIVAVLYLAAYGGGALAADARRSGPGQCPG